MVSNGYAPGSSHPSVQSGELAMVIRRIRTCVIGGLAAAIAVIPLTLGGPAHAAADGCSPGVKSDFNGDGRSDTVVGRPVRDRRRSGPGRSGDRPLRRRRRPDRRRKPRRRISGQPLRRRYGGGRRPVRLGAGCGRSRLRRLHRPGRRHTAGGHQRPGRLRLRADHLGQRGRTRRRRRLAADHPERLPQRRHHRRRPVRLRAGRARGRRTGRHPTPRTRTPSPSGCPAATSAD